MKKIVLLLICVLAHNISFPQHSPKVYNTDSIINVAVNSVNQDSIESYVQDMQNMGTRFMIADNRKDIAQWLEQKFLSFGIDSVYLDSFECYTNINYQNLHYDTTTWQYNVIARIEGSLYPEQTVIIGGHYDCVTPDTSSIVYSPGADDDASGTASVLESARVIKSMDYLPERSVEFIAFAAEELMNFGDAGSEHYADFCANENKDIVAMINNDMIGYDDGSWEIGISNFYNSDNATAAALNVATNHTSLSINHWPASQGFADAAAFWQNGYECVYLEESVFNPWYHTTSDLIEYMDMAYCSEVIKIAVGTILCVDRSLSAESKHDKFAIKIYPNPVEDFINIEFQQKQYPVQLQIINSNAQVVFSQQMTNSKETFDVSMLAKGFYVLKFITFKQVITAKVVKN